MSLLIESSATGAAGHLGVLPRRQGGATSTAEFGEALEHHGACRHVDPQREGLGGEDHSQQSLAEAHLDCLPECRDETCMVGGDSCLKALEPLVEPQSR